jgi:non-haem Fe2+, alpha-ketoglutarate-dependent halogenase
VIQEYNLKNFNKNGVAWSYKLEKNYDVQELKDEYFKFKDTSLKVFSKEVSLKPHLLSNFFYKLAIDKNILKCVKEIIGENVYIWSSAFFPKAPGEGKIVSFHQDNPYWQLTTTKVVTAWIALTSSDLNSGALQAVPKSHKLGLIKKLDVGNARKSYLKGIKTTATNDLLSYKQNLEDFIKKNVPLTINLSPGEFSIHHVNTVHGSGINKSSDYRIGFAVRYVSSETQHLEEQKDFATHIMGKKNEYYEDEIPPTEDFDEKALNQYQISMNSTGVFGNKKY